jgi:hypothetical protein
VFPGQLYAAKFTAQEDKILGEEVEVVLRMEVEKGIRTAKFFINIKEIIARIKVILGHVEGVSVVLVKPLVMVDGVEDCLEMVDKISRMKLGNFPAGAFKENMENKGGSHSVE